MPFVYILHAVSQDRYYKGQTCDIIRRLNAHNGKQEKSTSCGVPWELVWCPLNCLEEFIGYCTSILQSIIYVRYKVNIPRT